MVVFVLLIVNYFCFVYKKKFLVLVKKHQHENGKKRSQGRIFIFLYVLGTVALFAICL